MVHTAIARSMRSIIRSVAHAPIRQNSPLSCPTIARRLGVSLPTAMHAADDLLTIAFAGIPCPLDSESIFFADGPLPSFDLSIVAILARLKDVGPCLPGLVASPWDAEP